MSDSQPKISFENTEVAYAYLSNNELRKAYWLFRLMSINWLVGLGNSVIHSMLKLNFPIQSIIKNTIFSHFCGGESLDESIPLINRLKKNNIEVLLNYSVEGLEDATGYRDTYEKTLNAIHFAKENPSVRAMCVKFTGYAHTDIWVKLQAKQVLTQAEQQEFLQAKSYIDKLCSEAVNCDVHLYVDAEESWFQDSIDDLVDEMMEKYNKEEAYIFNTYQLYRNDKLEDFKKAHQRAIEKGYILGAKIVRGAYVEKENDYYVKLGKKSPINDTKDASDREFDGAVRYAVENVTTISLCCASHNEASNKLYFELLTEKNIPLNHKHVNASQLLGMSDNITYNLSALGMNTAKYMPFGPVKEVIPYLIRRAQENTSVEGQTSRELLLLKKEMERRGI
ncbi:MAG: proline dehydrogenase family protein [Chitinophagales bacterium]|jgi:proline dehydrogenase|nr:proline dehydrogenase family protein [Sphingobacteriales bacterium]